MIGELQHLSIPIMLILLCANIYNVTVSDANGCAEVLTIPVSNTGSPTSVVPTISDVSCNGICDGSFIE